MFKKILLLFVLAFITLIPAFAENFYIENYDVQIKVNKDKSLNITENIDTFFTQSSHGIFRTIPLGRNHVMDIVSSEQASISRNANSINIRLGNPDRYVLGKQNYNISYIFNILDRKDNEFYFNIIGTDWNVPINKVKFSVSMPDNFDPNKAGISIGSYGTRGFSDGAEYYIENNTIYGQTTKKLKPNEGITLRIELPNGYFSCASPDFTEKYPFLGLALLATGLSYLLWFKIGKDNITIPVVSFYPPKNMNSAVAEAVYKGKDVSNKGLSSLIVYFASKGYLKITDNSDGFTLEKLKEYDGKNQTEKNFFKALFDHGNKVNDTDLSESRSFYNTCQTIMKELTDFTRKIIYEEDSIDPFNYFLSLICLLSVISLFLFALIDYNFSNIVTMEEPIFPLILFPIIALIVLCTSKNKTISLYIWVLGFGGVPAFIVGKQIIPVTTITLFEIIFYVVCIIICAICLKELPKKNARGQRLLGQLLGLKKFIEVTEKNRLKTLVEDNPEYFYDILPFAYIFGISDIWIEKFESIMQISPDWYQGNHFSSKSFNNLTRNMANASAPSVANGGISTSSSGGGGFSGGGSGGGGGGSW